MVLPYLAFNTGLGGEDDPETVTEPGREMRDLLQTNPAATGEDFIVLYASLFGQEPGDLNNAIFDDYEVLDSPTAVGGVIARSTETGFSTHVHGGGVISEAMTADVRASEEGLEASLEAALQVKNLNMGPIALNGGGDTITTLIGEKAAEMVGLEITNPTGVTLDEAHPEIAQRMEEVWAQMQQEEPELAQESAMTADAAAVAPGDEQTFNPHIANGLG